MTTGIIAGCIMLTVAALGSALFVFRCGRRKEKRLEEERQAFAEEVRRARSRLDEDRRVCQAEMQRTREQFEAQRCAAAAQAELVRDLKNEEEMLRSAIQDSVSGWVGKAMANPATGAIVRAQELIVRLLRDGKLSLDIAFAIQNVLLDRGDELRPLSGSGRREVPYPRRSVFFHDITGAPGSPHGE
jgi:hypothetical protein